MNSALLMSLSVPPALHMIWRHSALCDPFNKELSNLSPALIYDLIGMELSRAGSPQVYGCVRLPYVCM